MAGQGREQHPVPGVEDGEGEAGRGLGVLGPQRGRKLEPPARGRALQGVGDGRLVPAQGLVLEVGGGGAQQLPHRQGQHHRQHRHGQKVQPDDLPEEGIPSPQPAASASRYPRPRTVWISTLASMASSRLRSR